MPGAPTTSGVEIECSDGLTVIRVREPGSGRGTLLLRGMFLASAAGYGLTLVIEASHGTTVEVRPWLSPVYVALCVIALSACRFWCGRRWADGASREVLRVGLDGVQAEERFHPLIGVDGIHVIGPGMKAGIHEELDCRARGAPLWPSRVYGVAASSGDERTTLVLGIEAHQAKVVAEELAALLDVGTAMRGHRRADRGATDRKTVSRHPSSQGDDR